jgi:hypothetical protein
MVGDYSFEGKRLKMRANMSRTVFIASTPKGMILVIILLLLSLVQCLMLASVALIEDSVRLVHHFSNYVEREVTLKKGLELIYPLITSGKLTCFVHPMSSSEWIHKTETWWLSSGICQRVIDPFVIRYAFERLDSDPCLFTPSGRLAQYFRVTLRMSDLKNKDTSFLGQMTFVLPALADTPCLEQKRTLVGTWQSWRELE